MDTCVRAIVSVDPFGLGAEAVGSLHYLSQRIARRDITTSLIRNAD